MKKNLNVDKLQLWKNIRNYNFGSPDSLISFIGHTAIRLGWSTETTRRVFEEYKKFVYLSVISHGHTVPSDMIDKVWQRHFDDRVIYEEFCMDYIGYSLDMNIIREYAEGDDEGHSLHGRYLDTLALYQKEFGVVPPSSIWGTAVFDDESVEDDQKTAGLRSDAAMYGISPNVEREDDDDFTPLVILKDSDTSDDDAFKGFGGGDFGGGGSSGTWEEKDDNNIQQPAVEEQPFNEESVPQDPGEIPEPEANTESEPEPEQDNEPEEEHSDDNDSTVDTDN
ncbi:MAG TPA: hypothetical protein VL576_02130 [Candidatus Paceibacterota bacterium]|nr:hypothetical protein [Candidatus Paceibacterota bacterium]